MLDQIFRSRTIWAAATIMAAICFNPACAVGQVEAAPTSAAVTGLTQPLAPTGDPAADIGVAREAIKSGHYDDAVRTLTKVLEGPKGPLAQQARELLGLAREKNNQLAHAEAEYRQYLTDYPGGADAARVRQRLDGVIALENKPFEDLHKAAEERQRQTDEAAIAQAHEASVAAASRIVPTPAANSAGWNANVIPTQLLGSPSGALPTPSSAWLRSYDGSLGIYYTRNLGSTAIIDPINPGGTTTLNQLYQDTVSTQIDLRGSRALGEQSIAISYIINAMSQVESSSKFC